MIDWLVKRIFSWKPLYKAVTAEVHMYDLVRTRIQDFTPGSAYWNEGDGWRSWTYSKERKKYYFNDIPEESLSNAMKYTYESLGPEFDLDEVW